MKNIYKILNLIIWFNNDYDYLLLTKLISIPWLFVTYESIVKICNTVLNRASS